MAAVRFGAGVAWGFRVCGKRGKRSLGLKLDLSQDGAEFQSMMATAADFVVADVEELVELGECRRTRFIRRGFW